jgi:hypothetical protein
MIKALFLVPLLLTCFVVGSLLEILSDGLMELAYWIDDTFLAQEDEDEFIELKI